jgi:hypothetical protein
MSRPRPNLFDYATKELSQDAFICWLLEWSDTKYSELNPELHSAGLGLLNALLELHDESAVLEPTLTLYQQLLHVDIVVEVGDDVVLMIEDKVHSKEHAAQLIYSTKISEHFPGRRVLPIYFKTGDQCDYQGVEEVGYRCFLRSDFLAVLNSGIEQGVTDPIYSDFRDYLQDRDADVEGYALTPVLEWQRGSRLWVGFFKALKVAKPRVSWEKVNNPSGGFWAAFWYELAWNDHRVYLQIEESLLCFKIDAGDTANRSEIRDSWRDRLLEEAERFPALHIVRPKRLGNGRWMTVASVGLSDWMASDSAGRLNFKTTLKRLEVAEQLMVAAAGNQ